MQIIYFLERVVYMQSEDKKEERQVAKANNPLYVIGDMGSAVGNLIKGLLPKVVSKGVQATRQFIQESNTYSVDDEELRGYAKGFAGRNPDARLDSGEKVTTFSTMARPIPELYSEFKNIKSKENTEHLTLDGAIKLLKSQQTAISKFRQSHNSQFSATLDRIVTSMSSVHTNCAQYNAAYAQNEEEQKLKTLYQKVSRAITGANATIASAVKKYIQQKMDWTADIDKYKFYFMVCLICSKNDPGMGLCGRAMHAEFARLPLPNTAKRES